MYELLNIKWGDPTYGTPSGTINWQDDLGGLTAASGSNTGDLVTALENAFFAWENVAAVDFLEGGAIDLQVTYSSFSTDAIFSNDGAAATASWSGVGQPSNTVITFNSDLTWAPNGGGGINFYAVALHEIGHILGLDHVNDPTEIMNPTIFANELGDGDIAGAQFLYGTDGSDEPAPFVPADGPSVTSSGGDDGGGGGGAIALLVGLLALVIGVFTGGAGAAVALAAGRVATDGDDTDDLADDNEHDHDVDVMPDGTVTHVTFVPEMPLPMVEFDYASMAADEDELEEAFFI